MDRDDIWFGIKAVVVLTIILTLCLLLFVGIRGLIRNTNEHQTFLRQHCKVIATVGDSSSYGYGLMTNGKYGYGIIDTPGSKTYKCDDHITRTEQD